MEELRYYHKDLKEREFLYSIVGNCREDLVVTPANKDGLDNEEIRESICNTMAEMFGVYRPSPELMEKSIKVASFYYSNIIRVQNLDEALKAVCDEYNLAKVEIQDMVTFED